MYASRDTLKLEGRFEKLKTEGGYKRRKEDVERNEAIMTVLHRGGSWSHVIAATGCSRYTLSRLARRVRKDEVIT